MELIVQKRIDLKKSIIIKYVYMECPTTKQLLQSGL